MEGHVNPDEAPRDPGTMTTHHSYTDKDFEGHRAHTMYVGLHVPGSRRRGHHRRRHHHSRNGSRQSDDGMSVDVGDFHRPVTPPAERVHFILGEDEDGTHESHPLFSEMEELYVDGGEMEWRETARWVKFEEDVEEGGNRWSKPHVATISLHSLFELRSCILNGTVMLDMEAHSLDQIADLVLENMINSNHLAPELRERVKEALLRRHRHQHERRHDRDKPSRIPFVRSLADIGRNSSKTMFASHNSPSSNCPENVVCTHPNGNNGGTTPAPGFTPSSAVAPGSGATNNQGVIPQSPSTGSLGTHLGITNLSDAHNTSSADLQHKLNQAFMRKIPAGAEASNVLVGEVDFLDRAVTAFIRLGQACPLGDLTEVPVPTRFLFVLLGPSGNLGRYHEIGRAMATILSDEVFHDVAYKARNRQDLLAGVDEFLDAVTVLPPGAWDPSIRIEPPQQLPSQESRKKPESNEPKPDHEEEEDKEREENGLKRTGRLFGGLINDVRRKYPWYLSDFRDALALQSVASIFFLYFACIAPIITFGGLLEDATKGSIAAMESLLSGAVCGVLYGLFSGQPLTILGSTGPVLVFESILFDFCQENQIYYLSFRLWIGLWTSGILMILVASDSSALVCYITRFTEENFATLISLIFIYKAIEKVLSINIKTPFHTGTIGLNLPYSCACLPSNMSDVNGEQVVNWTTTLDAKQCTALDGVMVGEGCGSVPDVFLFSFILFISTFTLSISLKSFKTSSFFPTAVRQFVSDFAVVIAIVSMTGTDYITGINTPKLMVPEEFKPTSSHRGWVIGPFDYGNQWWTALAAFLPALLATILIFMDQQITAVIINRKENKLKKGCGYHLDLFVLCILIAICSILGLPWFVAATVLAMTHVNSLRMESESAAPGEKPQFLGVREQRVTQVVISSMIGLSVFFTSVLKCIPMPVLYGVFLYMGISSLKGSQFFDRILIMFMPQKYQPDLMFLRHVPTWRCHVFTFIQLACLILLWVIKSFKKTSIAFPLMLVVMIGVRKMLDFLFTQRELKLLDDVMPEHTKRKREEDQMKQEEEYKDSSDSQGMLPNAISGNNVAIPLANGNILKVPMERFKEEDTTNINVTEQLSKTGMWQSIDQQSQNTPSKAQPKNNGGSKKKRGSKKDALNEEERKRLSTMAEDEEDDDAGRVTIRIEGPTPAHSASHSRQNSPCRERKRSASLSNDNNTAPPHNETSV